MSLHYNYTSLTYIYNVIACFRAVIDEAAKALRNAAGNYYVNDKSTGSIVAQQPFGGARASGKPKAIEQPKE